MKKVTILKSLAVAMTLSFSMSSLADKLTEKQKEELYNFGRVTVEHGVFEIGFLPGKENILKNQSHAWDQIGDKIAEMAKFEDFWHKKVYNRMMDGVNFAKDACENGVCQIPKQFHDTMDKNDQIHGFGASVAKVTNWLKFCGYCFEDLCVTTLGGAAGLVWSVAAPTATVLWRPVVIGTKAVAAGTVYPTLLAYNWVADKLIENEDAPQKGDFTVTYIPNKFKANEFAEELAPAHADL